MNISWRGCRCDGVSTLMMTTMTDLNTADEKMDLDFILSSKINLVRQLCLNRNQALWDTVMTGLP